MNRRNTPWQPVKPATVLWRDDGSPTSVDYEDVYYSSDNGLEESRHVYLNGNNLPQRWTPPGDRHFCIGELGFGTGLNFLLTWQAWRALPESRPDLHYIAFERHPLTLEDLQRALRQWPTLQPLAEELAQAYPGLHPGQHRLVLAGNRLRLDLWWEPAAAALMDLAGRDQPMVDAWYLDGFAPARNKSMWSPQLLQAVASLSRDGASFATFTAAGEVRRNLTAAGFHVDKFSGFGRKRECLRGSLQQQYIRRPGSLDTPWDTSNAAMARPNSALVVGGGLAGCTVAAALAVRGIRVTLLEQDTLANAGSGNDQGILYTRLSRKHSSLADFALESFRFAAAFYQALFRSGLLQVGRDGDLCGNFQQSDNHAEMLALQEPISAVPQLAQILDAATADQVLGITQSSGGYWYPAAGWLHPAAVCGALVQHKNIEVIQHCSPLTLRSERGQWQALAADKTIAAAPCAIAATGIGTLNMAQFKGLPLQSIRGQTTQIPTSASFSRLRAALCHDGYIAPARAGFHSVGATFDPADNDSSERAQDHRSNLEKLAAAVPAWQATLQGLDSNALAGRVGYRCASPDYLPIVGPATDFPVFEQAFSSLRKNAKQLIPSHGPHLPGLYVSTAHGSRGLSSTPIAAELLASLICGEPPPFSRELTRALHPARFIIRDLSRNRI